MIKLEFKKDTVNIKQRRSIHEVFDVVRKKWFVLTPEEWVRQNVIHYLIGKNYPASLIAVEKLIMLGELKKRCDIVIYDRHAKTFMIIECKEMDTNLSSKAMEQILRYHIALPAKYLIITNGVYCFGFKKINDQFIETDHFPEYEPG